MLERISTDDNTKEKDTEREKIKKLLSEKNLYFQDVSSFLLHPL